MCLLAVLSRRSLAIKEQGRQREKEKRANQQEGYVQQQSLTSRTYMTCSSTTYISYRFAEGGGKESEEIA